MAQTNYPDQKLILQAGNTSSRTISNSTTETSLIPPNYAGQSVIPGNWFTPGANSRIVMYGTCTTPLAVGTATIRVKIGGVTVASAVTTSLLASLTAQQFNIRLNIQCYTVGTSGTFGIGGSVRYPSGLLGIGSGEVPIVATGIVFDSTVAQSVDVTLQWSGLNHSVTTAIYYMELMPKNSM